MIPDKRVKRALLNVEIRQITNDIAQVNAAILHILSGGARNYNNAKESNNRKKNYTDTPDEILSKLENQRQDLESRLRVLSNELDSLNNEKE